MKFPWTPLLLVPVPFSETPWFRFPEMTLRAAAVVPPIVLACAPVLISTPAYAFGTAAVPAMFKPMKFPATTLLFVPVLTM